MLTLLKAGAGVAIALAVINPGFAPRADNCECKAKANGAAWQMVPRADDCECKAKANGIGHVVPHADTCECKAKTNK